MAKVIYIGIIVTITSICFIGFFLSSNNKELQTPIIQNVSLKENGNHQEETEIINNNLTILDNQYLNIIIFLVFFLLIFYLFFYSFLNPPEIIGDVFYKDNNKLKLKKAHIFLKTVYLDCKITTVLQEVFYTIKNKNKNDDDETQITEENINNFNPEDHKVTRHYRIKKGIIDEEISKDISGEEEKRDKIKNIFPQIFFMYPELTEVSEIDELFKEKEPNYTSKTVCFQNPKITYFNLRNFIAFLLNSGLFLIFFVIPYLVFYFLFVFIYALIFIDQEKIEEKNKFLFVFHKVRDAVLLSNIHNLLKIIPLICFLIEFIFNSYRFFRDFKSDDTWIPLLFDVEKKKFINIYLLHPKNIFLKKEGKIYESRYEFFGDFDENSFYF